MPQRSHRRRRTWLILAALALLALIPFAIHHSRQVEASITGSSLRTITPPGKNPSTRLSRQGRQRSSTQDQPTSHATEDLDTFFLPPTDLSQVSMEEAMNTLLSHYRNICRETAEGPIQFHCTIHGEPDPIFYLKLGGNFISNCKFIAAMAGMTLEIENDQLTFTEVEDGPPSQRRWTEPPDFPSFLPDLTELGIPTAPFEDPFYSRPDIRKLLLGLGVIKENDPVSFLPSSSTLILRTAQKISSKLTVSSAKPSPTPPIKPEFAFPTTPLRT